jgi:putative transposase
MYPNKSQVDLLSKTFGCVRFVWNKSLGNAIEAYEAFKLDPTLPKPKVSSFGFVKDLTKLKQQEEFTWLKEVSSVPLQQTLLDLGKSYSNFFRGISGFPTFKCKSNHESFKVMTNAFNLKDNKFFLAKCKDPIKVKWSRELPSYPSSATISKTPSGKYFVSFLCEVSCIPSLGTGSIGIDLGLTDFATTSEGVKYPNPRHHAKAQAKLTKLQRRLARKRKESNRRNKQRILVAKQYEKITNQRNDFLHKLSTTLINENQVIGIETLKVKDMLQNKKLRTL